MNDLKQEALLFVERLQTLYFEQRDLSTLLDAMALDTSWIGTGAMEICRNLNDAKTALSLESQEASGSFTVTLSNFDVTIISENSCVVYGEIVAKPSDPHLADVQNRLTAVCARTSEGMKLLHVHMSVPDVDLEDGRFYLDNDSSGQRETLRSRAQKTAYELRARNDQLEALTENIPGGVHQCEYNDSMTFLSMSTSFLTLVGYSEHEIRHRFHNNFSEMIYPDDLPRIKAEMTQQLLCGDALEIEYRIVRGDGKLLWILDQGKRATLSDDSRCFYCVLIDITREKEEREELRLTLERHQIILDQTTDIIFEWDITADTLTFSSNWQKKFGYEPIHDNISNEVPLSMNIHASDMPAFIKIMEDSTAGIPFSETEFRIRDIWGAYKWHRIRATVQYDSQHRPVKAVGVILDIDADKMQKEQLLDQAQRDPLTSLYNKTAVRELVTTLISAGKGDGFQALLIIDVDNFKGVNDTFGHLCGDSLLCDVSMVLRSHFRATDIVGRIGGDEFLVFLPDVSSESDTAKKISALLEKLGALRPAKDCPPISCSIGAALFPSHDSDFFTLYKCADLALYHVKEHGKNDFAFWNHDATSCSVSDTAVGHIDSGIEIISDAAGDKLAQYSFRMLCNSSNISTAFDHLLEIVGGSYGASRVYIFERIRDEKKLTKTFEWDNRSLCSAEIGSKDLDVIDDIGTYASNFAENNVFYCHNIGELDPSTYEMFSNRGVQSFLQCAIIDDGVFIGFVGFDECCENREWTKAQVASLSLFSNVLTTFLLKMRLKEDKQNDAS